MPSREIVTTADTPGWAERLVRVLDDGIRIPGTHIGLGLDAVLGLLLPAAGDATTAVASLSLLALAWRRRVPTVTILRMVVNIAVDALLGSVPILGDVFDLLWHSNRKNLQLVTRYQGHANPQPSTGDYLVVGTAFAVAVLALLTPLVLAMVYGTLLLRVLLG